MNADADTRIRKILFKILMAGIVVLLCFGGGKPPSARAHESGADTPKLLPPDLPDPFFQTDDGSGGSPLVNDAFYPPNRPVRNDFDATGSSAPGWDDTSVFMTGSIAIGVILPESMGPASTEDWDTARENQVTAKVQEGLARWVDWSNDYGVNLVLNFEFNYGVPTTHEPITSTSVNFPGQCNWIPEVMTSLGFPGINCFDQVQDYINDLRDRHTTDWAFAVFVVDSLNDADGTFTDGYFAYAYLGGPFIMMTYDNDGWGIEAMDVVVQHEMAHIFYAADTYSAPGYGGCMNNVDPYGYLGIPNSNCEVISAAPLIYNPDADTDVLMTNSNPNRVHWTTLHQVGWRDSDGDRTPDVLDTVSAFQDLIPYSPNPTSTNHLAYSAYAYDNPHPHANYTCCIYHDTTVNTITSVEYRVNGGSWRPAAPADGVFDTDYEYFSFDTGRLSYGIHTVEVRAKNSVNNFSDIWSDTVTIVPPPPGVFGKSAPADGADASTAPTLSWGASSGAAGYESCVDTIDNGECDTSWISTGTSRSADLSGLTAGTTYYWQVHANNAGGTTEADGSAWWNFTAQTQTFADVPVTYWAWSYIERLFAAGITGGCASSPLRYCPAGTVTRGQMAIFLERGMNGSGYTPPAATGTVFGDVPISYWAAAWIEKLYADGITGGCGGGNFCPDQAVTRAEMAIFLLRAEHGSAYTPPAATGTVFGDVPISHWAAAWIEQLSAEGITGGCGGGNFCPDQAVTRAEMAVFLVRAFSLP